WWRWRKVRSRRRCHEGTITPFRRAPIYDFEMGACLHPERRFHRTAVEICNGIHMLAAEHAHDGDLFLQIRVAKHRAEGGVRIREQGPVFQVHQVNHVSECTRFAWLAVQTNDPFLLWVSGVAFLRTG